MSKVDKKGNPEPLNSEPVNDYRTLLTHSAFSLNSFSLTT
jgi:hypothetical protein